MSPWRAPEPPRPDPRQSRGGPTPSPEPHGVLGQVLEAGGDQDGSSDDGRPGARGAAVDSERFSSYTIFLLISYTGNQMPRVEVRDDESLEKALRRFKRMLEREGTLKALKAKKHYEKPSERKRRELRQAISRRARTA